jgi:hypothetical protein
MCFFVHFKEILPGTFRKNLTFVVYFFPRAVPPGSPNAYASITSGQCGGWYLACRREGFQVRLQVYSEQKGKSNEPSNKSTGKHEELLPLRRTVPHER